MELHDEEFLETEQALIERIRNFGQDDFADAMENAIEFGGLDRRKRPGETEEAYEDFLRDCPWACFGSETSILFNRSSPGVVRYQRQATRITHVFTYFLGSKYLPKRGDSTRVWFKDKLHSQLVTGVSKRRGGSKGMGNILYSINYEKRFFRIMMLYASADHRPTWQRVLEYLYEHPRSSAPDISEGVGLGKNSFTSMIIPASGPIPNMLRGENPILIKEAQQYKYNLRDEFREVYEDFYPWISSEEGIEIYKDWLELYHHPIPR